MSKTRIIRLVLILVVAAVVYWQRGRAPQSEGASVPDGEKPTAVLKENPLGEEKPKAILKENPLGKAAPSSSTEKVRGYDKLTGARLVENDGNDGDSFHVRAGGKDFELRLYFVDAPEKYLSDRFANQRERVEEQGREMGGISPEQAIEVGKAAKLFTERAIKGQDFTIYTYWEPVYEGDRYYGFVELPEGGYLGTQLVENGLARIHTKGPGSKENPVPTPDGKSFFEHRDMLRDREREARESDRGAWSLR